MRFIRKNGRIIPIREKKEKPGDSQYKKFAAAGAVGGAATRAVTRQAVIQGRKLPLFRSKFALAGVAAYGLGLGAANIKNSYEYGKREKSFSSGLGRFFANSFVMSVGNAAGRMGTQGTISGLNKARKTGVFTKIGNMMGRASGKTQDFVNSMRGPKKGVNLSKFKGKTFRSYNVEKVQGLIGYNKK